MTGTMYELLPAHMRTLDEEGGQPLAALFSLLEREAALIEEDIARLSETWFIETCPPWAIPYIGALLEARALHDLGPESGFSARAWVGNTIRNRKRKGTLEVIEAVGAEATGFPARAAEMFERLSATQWLNHPRPHRNASASIRDGDAMALTGSAFDRTPRTAEMRRIDRGAGRYSLPNVAVHLWRMQPYRMIAAEAAALDDHRFHIDPLGREIPLYWPGRTERGVAQLAELVDMPVPLAIRPLHRELEALRQAMAGGIAPPEPVWFGDAPAFAVSLQVAPGDPFVEVPPARIAICDIHDSGGGWRRPPASLDYVTEGGATETLPITLGVDPLRGRIALPEGEAAAALRVTHTYAAPGDLGGGPYARRVTDTGLLGRPAGFQVGVSKRLPPDGATIVGSLAEAVGLWNAQPPGTAGIIAIMDNDRFEEDLTGPDAIRLEGGAALAIVSADWPEQAEEEGTLVRRPGTLVATGRRAALVGPLQVISETDLGADLPCVFSLDGVLIDGQITLSGDPGRAFGTVSLTHVGQVPRVGGLRLEDPAIEDRLIVERCVLAGVALGEAEADLVIADSIVDGSGGAAVDAPMGELHATAATLIGATSCGELFAGDTLFDGPVTAARSQAGCMQYCAYDPGGARTPRRYRCQPDLALAGRPPEEHAAIVAGLRPSYAADSFGAPGYGRLADASPQALLTGASDGGTIGAWHFLRLPWRNVNFTIAAEEYLPFGLRSGTIFET